VKSPSTNTTGIYYMLVAIFCLGTMDAFAKLLVKERFEPEQILALRSWLILAALLVFYTLRRRLGQLSTQRPLAQIGRGVLGFFAPYCFFKSLQTLPLADATVIFFSSTFMITLLSSLALGEQVGPKRWAAVVLGFIGVLVAIEPTGEGDWISYGYCLLGSLSYAVLFIAGRWLSKTETVISLVFFFNLSLAVFATGLASSQWIPLQTSDYAPLLLFTLLAMVGHICITQAFSRADAALIAPLEYTALIWAVLWGYVIWGDVPSTRVWLGSGIIIGCALFVLYRQQLKPAKRS